MTAAASAGTATSPAPAAPPAGERTLTELFYHRAATFAGKPCLFTRQPDGAWTSIDWRELLRRVELAARGLHAAGIRPGDRVALLSENRAEWVVADLAILCLGAASVPIYPTSTPPQVRYILENSGSRALFLSTPDQLAKVRAVALGLDGLHRIVCFDPPGQLQGKETTLAELLAGAAGGAGADLDVRSRALGVSPESLASLIYTSGTTGQPKGVMLSHWNFASNVLASCEALKVHPTDRHLSFLPLCHAFERTAGYYLMLHRGVEIWYAESIDRLQANLPEVKPTILLSVPRLYEKIYLGVQAAIAAKPGLGGKLARWALRAGNARSAARLAGRRGGPWQRLRWALADRLVLAKIRERFGGRIRLMCSGGAALPGAIGRFFLDVGLLILEGYGLTETSPVACINREDAFRFGTVGQTIPGVEVKIAADGEVLIKGPNIMQGYFQMPEATRDCLAPDGWFHSGDIGELSADGYLKITDRKKDLFKTSGGKYIAPQALESLFKRDPLIGECVICGDGKHYVTALIVPDWANLDRWAQEHGLDHVDRPAIVATPAVQALYRARLDALSGDLARFETVKKFTLLPVEFSQEAGQLTPTMKVRRRVVNQQFASQIEAMYAGEREAAP